MRSRPPTDAELRETFEEQLALMVSGAEKAIPSCTGLDDEVEAALGAVAAAAPNPPVELVEAARAAFANR